MKVKELIEELQKLPQDLKVLMSQDPEGNGYSAFSGGFSLGYSEAPDEYRPEWTSEEDWGWQYDGEDVEVPPYPGNNVVVMWP